MKLIVTYADLPSVPKDKRGVPQTLDITPDWAVVVMAEGNQPAMISLHEVSRIEIEVPKVQRETTLMLCARAMRMIGNAIAGGKASFTMRDPGGNDEK